MSEVGKIIAFAAAEDKPNSEDLEWAFPNVKPGMRPYGGRVIVQIGRAHV